MKFIKGVTFAPFIKRGMLMKKETLESFDEMLKRTGADFVILVPNGLQNTPQSEEIDFCSEATMGDEELGKFIDCDIVMFGKERLKGLRESAFWKNIESEGIILYGSI